MAPIFSFYILKWQNHFLPLQMDVLYAIEEMASERTENENASGKVMVFYKPSSFTFIVPIVFGKKCLF